MLKTARKAASRQDVEATVKKIAASQRAYYDAWVADWTLMIERRAQNPKLVCDAGTIKKSDKLTFPN